MEYNLRAALSRSQRCRCDRSELVGDRTEQTVAPKEHLVEAGLVSGPAGSRPALYASLCLLFGGIPGNSAPGTTNLWNSSHNKLGGRKAHTSSCSTVKWGYALPFPAVSLFVLSSFLPPVRALLCGRLPHTAPLVLPARPRADKTTLLLSRHPHTRCLVGEFAMRLARIATFAS